MKTLISLILLSLNLVLFSQKAIVTGKIENPKAKEVKLVIYGNYGNNEEFKSKLDDNNNFKFEDDSLAEFRNSDYHLSPDIYMSKLLDKQDTEIKYLIDYFNGKENDFSDFIKEKKNDYQYKNASSTIWYLFNKQRKGDLKSKKENPEFNAVYEYLDDMNVNDFEAVGNISYNRFLYSYVNFYLLNRNEYTKKINLDSADWHMQRFLLAKSVYKDDVLDEFCYSHMKRYLKSGSISRIKTAYDEYQRMSKNKNQKNEIKAKYNSLIEHYNNPKVPEGSVVYKKEKEIKDLSLSKLLEKQKGKVIYLDFWGILVWSLYANDEGV